VHVYAAQDCELLVLPPRDFYELAGAFPALWAELKDVAERRKRDLEMMLKRTTSSP
jgi:CRP-like cAMP-binding protein